MENREASTRTQAANPLCPVAVDGMKWIAENFFIRDDDRRAEIAEYPVVKMLAAITKVPAFQITAGICGLRGVTK